MNRWIAPAAAGLVALAGAGWYLAAPAGQGGAAGLPLIPAANAQSAEVDTSVVTEMVLGAEDAPVEVIEYSSFTCPHCATFHNGGVYDRLKADYIDEGLVRWTYREVYFDKYGMWASMIARCGGEESFFGIVDMIYDTQDDWARAGSDADIAGELRRLALMAGLESDEVEACLTDGDRLRALVEWYRGNAEEHGIESTPSFVIDGRTYNNMSYAEFAEILDDRIDE